MTDVHPFARFACAEQEEAVLRQDAVDAAYRALTHGVDGIRNFPIFLTEIFERRAWERERIFSGGTRQGPVPFRDFVHNPYPVGLGATFDAIEKLIRGDVKLVALWTDVTKRKPGAPEGNSNAKPSDDTTVYNIHSCADRPSGTSAAAGLRKLTKAAAEGNEEAEAQLAEATSGSKSVHRACVDAGLRKSTRIDHDVKQRCERLIAASIVSSQTGDLSPVVADLIAAGFKGIAVEVEKHVDKTIERQAAKLPGKIQRDVAQQFGELADAWNAARPDARQEFLRRLDRQIA